MSLISCSNNPGNNTSGGHNENPIVTWHASPDSSRIDLGFPVLNVETTTLLQPDGKDEGIGTYSHHSHITYWRGRLVATWSNAPKDEDSPGQKVLMRISRNRGKSWGTLMEAFPPLPETVLKNGDTISSVRSDGVTMNANGYAKIGKRLFLIAECLYMPGQKGLGRLARELRKNGNIGPIFWLYDDPLIRSDEGEAFYTPYRDGTFSDIADKINGYLEEPDVFPSWDFLNYSTRPVAADGHVMCEPTYAWKLADGTWMRIYRDLDRSGYNYSSYSKDDGKTWSVPVMTNFPDAPARSNAGVLPDRTVYVVSNPRNNGDMGGPLYPRDPLAISLSSDGMNFTDVKIIRYDADPARFEGRFKDAGFEYPSSVIAGKYLFVMYSVNKEDIQVSKILLSDLKL